MKKVTATKFLKLIDKLFGKGWHGYGPILEHDDFLLFIAFHVNPVNADSCNSVLTKYIVSDLSRFWFYSISKSNRFYLGSQEFHNLTQELGSKSKAKNLIINERYDLGIKTVNELKKLTMFLEIKCKYLDRGFNSEVHQ